MPHPWEEILLADYESHMRLASVMQLQAMNEMMKKQLAAYPVSSVMILGVAGGNGLAHIQKEKYNKVYGIDIKPSYLREVLRRYPALSGVLECLCMDLTKAADGLPKAKMIIANLIIEYIGYQCFQRAVRRVEPKYVSCIIQKDEGTGWVSDSPYLCRFEGLEQIHRSIEEEPLMQAMEDIGYHNIKALTRPLPNGKKFVRLDFKR